jgi:hypothetical protein
MIAELVRRPVDDLRDPLARARSTLIAIRDHADHGIRDDPLSGARLDRSRTGQQGDLIPLAVGGCLFPGCGVSNPRPQMTGRGNQSTNSGKAGAGAGGVTGSLERSHAPLHVREVAESVSPRPASSVSIGCILVPARCFPSSSRAHFSK